jgi:hypothetical protein
MILSGDGFHLLAGVVESWVALGHPDLTFVRPVLVDSISKSPYLIKKMHVKWNSIIVYGAAQLEDKEKFLIELGTAYSDQELPLLIGGDFNIIRFPSEKNKTMRRNKWTDMFNSIINSHGLREIYLSDGQYTWSNNQQDPTLEKLDRFLGNFVSPHNCP